MKFKSVDELEQFRFQDAEIVSLKDKTDMVEMELEAVVVRGRHPLNETYTDRYADTIHMRLTDGKIRKAFKEGYKYYDANGVLLEEIPDEAISENDFSKLCKTCKDGTVFVLENPKSLKEKLGEQFPEQMEKLAVDELANENDKKIVIIAVDVDSVEEEIYHTYWLAVSYTKAILEWEHMMNKPEQM
jgi:hypothetical protein